MRALFLIATNFLREQRWPLFFLLLWVLGWAGLGLFGGGDSAVEDSLMIFRQLATYAVAFAVFFGSSAIAADQRARRILAVLSKAVSRDQYLLGLLAGIAMVLGIFCACIGLTASWLLGRFASGLGAIWFATLAIFAACLLAAALTLLLSTLLPPLFAAIGAGMVAGVPTLLAMQGRGWARYVLPIYGLLESIMTADIGAWRLSPGIVGTSLAETAILMLVANWIFGRRDLAVAVE